MSLETSKKSKSNVIQSIQNLMDQYGMSDWAFYCRTEDGVAFGSWECGQGKNDLDKREKLDILYSNLERLQKSIIEHK